MSHQVEFHGRLARSDKRPANPGRYDLLFQLHPSREGAVVLWKEVVHGVDVMPGGFYSVVLGSGAPLQPRLFDNAPRYLSVRVVRGSTAAEEVAARVPMLGNEVVLGGRLAALERQRGKSSGSGASGGGSANLSIEPLKVWLEELRERLDILEDRDESGVLHSRLDAIDGRLGVLDAEGGRLDRIDDELEDLVGPDGDVLDLNQRMDHLEGKAPSLIKNLRERANRLSSVEEMEALQLKLSVLARQVVQLTAQLETMTAAGGAGGGATEAPTADDLGVVRRAGDVMTGGLTINRGGLEVLSGGVTCRGASVTTLEAANLVKAPKVIADAIELRGDFTVDNTRRVLQVRTIEGRQGSARRDGALHLNTRGGGEVVVGTEDASRGMSVHGQVSGGSFVAGGTVVAQVFLASGSPSSGELVRFTADGERVGRCSDKADPAVLGVATDGAGVLLGHALMSDRVAVALLGVCEVKVDATAGAIAPGDRLCAGGSGGSAIRADPEVPGTAIVGKALTGLAKGLGSVRVLLGRG